MCENLSDPAWLTLIGLGEDGLAGLHDASRKALHYAQLIFGGPRHLTLVNAGPRGRAWPVPFSIEPVLRARGKRVVVLASGDPFWHGAGGSLTQHLTPAEWQCFPALSCVALAAAHLGWRAQDVQAVALHAAPFEHLIAHLNAGQRLFCTLRDGLAPRALAQWLTQQGFGASRMTLLAALGGPREQIHTSRADRFDLPQTPAPVMVALQIEGRAGLPQSPGRDADLFAHDGQITKGPMRALTLAALAPRAGQHLWDIGAGSGSVSVEWALAATGASSSAVEPRADRIQNITENARRFGLLDRITPHLGAAPQIFPQLPPPDAVFLGGGGSESLFRALWDILPPGTRVVANAVTLQSQALLTRWQDAQGGSLMKIDLAMAQPLGRGQGWQAARSQLQWSVLR